jgi:pyridoxal phosphate enzyme (YggS family)
MKKSLTGNFVDGEILLWYDPLSMGARGEKGAVSMSAVTESLAENVRIIEERVAAACVRADRPRDSVRIVAITKYVDPPLAEALVDLGVTDLGENRTPSLAKKLEVLRERNIVWHFVGHLQRNKAQHVVGVVDLIHSVDSMRLAERLDRLAGEQGIRQDVLIEANIAGEAAKHGATAEETERLVRDVVAQCQCPNLRVTGLMTMAPIADDPETVRPVFRSLRELQERLGLEDVHELSMGMTQDFEVAIEEGATLIRVGSAYFAGVID